MLFILSPAKSLDYETPVSPDLPHSLPRFAKQTQELVGLLREKSVQDVAEMMELSDTLAALNVARFAAFAPKFTAKNAKQAVLAFDGDVYDGLQAKTLSAEQLAWAQDHVRILSGLYGVLRPLDWMQPYRLEMGRSLTTARGKNLYQFWGAGIAQALNTDLAHAEHGKSPVVVNLASQEYFKSVQTQRLTARVIECVFEEKKPAGYKVVSFSAKRARGLMCRFAIEKKIKTPAALQKFAVDGYAFEADASSADRLVFRRG
jgi:cytoplasmic iron level regulating protein YaaA (DUF328/UPF0246 family)